MPRSLLRDPTTIPFARKEFLDVLDQGFHQACDSRENGNPDNRISVLTFRQEPVPDLIWYGRDEIPLWPGLRRYPFSRNSLFDKEAQSLSQSAQIASISLIMLSV